MTCPQCGNELRPDATSCPSCKASLVDSFSPTRRIDSSGDKTDRTPARPASSFESIDDVRFVPGTMLAERYRIVGLLGRGGMGEVYRADDLKLSQPVALKFLPDHLLTDGAAQARFHREVRVARQVSHKNVCRVYDIGEVDGRHFLSMEFIKGEELSSLLRRIGRLPEDKAIQLARQICAGLAAAHDAGVLHRDLKPANVMIDEYGNARITDFGLAGLAEEFQQDEMRAGTPAYMAPEQLDGQTFTIRSDIYSLGLVLYELFTGKKAFDATTLSELIKLRRSDSTPTNPTSLVKDLDPIIERVIERCIQKDPQQRPSSALQVAAALPGGDPIAAALAAGETPSPEMVAAAPKQGTLRPIVAVGFLAGVIVLLAASMLLSGENAVHRLMPLKKPPEVLSEQANQIAKSLGYTSAPADTAHGFQVDPDYVKYLSSHHESLNPFEVLRKAQPPPARFWYRQSPVSLVPYSGQYVVFNDPPNLIPGMVSMTLDSEGQLFSFDAVPEQVQGPAPQSQSRPIPVDWPLLFRSAGLDITRFQPTQSQWTPPRAYDAREAWNGFYPGLPQVPIRIEAAAYQGKPIYFEIISPWTRPISDGSDSQTKGQRSFTWILIGIFLATMLVASLLALRNLRLARGDRRGAFRVALFLFFIRMVHWSFGAHHVGGLGELPLLITGLQSALFWSCFAGVLYLALEPYLRRRWPQRIISWNRLLVGDFRDPLVGRDILIGAFMGSLCILSTYLRLAIPKWFGQYPGMPEITEGFDRGLAGAGVLVGMFIDQISASVVQAFIVVFVLLFLSLLLRRDWLGITLGLLLFVVLFVTPKIGQDHPIGLIFVGLLTVAIVFCGMRFGLLALMSLLTFFHLWVFFPITTEVTSWYATSFVFDVLFLLMLAFYGFYTSLGGQSPFGGRLLED